MFWTSLVCHIRSNFRSMFWGLSELWLSSSYSIFTWLYFGITVELCNAGPGVWVWEKHRTKLLGAPELRLMEFGAVFLFYYSWLNLWYPFTLYSIYSLHSASQYFRCLLSILVNTLRARLGYPSVLQEPVSPRRRTELKSFMASLQSSVIAPWLHCPIIFWKSLKVCTVQYSIV